MQNLSGFASLKNEASYARAHQANEYEQQFRFSLMPADVVGCAEMCFHNAIVTWMTTDANKYQS